MQTPSSFEMPHQPGATFKDSLQSPGDMVHLPLSGGPGISMVISYSIHDSLTGFSHASIESKTTRKGVGD